MADQFWNLYPLYMKSPPLKVDPCDNVLKRHKGGSHRCAFWAGYDGLTGALYPPPRGSISKTAYRAGVAYRRKVDKGKVDALPME